MGNPRKDPRDGAAPRRGGGGGLFPFSSASAPAGTFPAPRSGPGHPGAGGAPLLLLTALPEEVFFRGYLYDAFEEAGWEPIIPNRPAVRRRARGAFPQRLTACLTFFPGPAVRVGAEKLGEHLRPVGRPFLFNLLPFAARGARVKKGRGAGMNEGATRRRGFRPPLLFLRVRGGVRDRPGKGARPCARRPTPPGSRGCALAAAPSVPPQAAHGARRDGGGHRSGKPFARRGRQDLRFSGPSP